MRDFTSQLLSPSSTGPCCSWALPIFLAIPEFNIGGFNFLNRREIFLKIPTDHFTPFSSYTLNGCSLFLGNRKRSSLNKDSNSCLTWHLSITGSVPHLHRLLPPFHCPQLPLCLVCPPAWVTHGLFQVNFTSVRKPSLSSLNETKPS